MNFTEALNQIVAEKAYLMGKPKFTLRELSQMTGGIISISHFDRLLKGKDTNPTRKTIMTLAKGLEVDPSVFVAGTPSQPRDKYVRLAMRIQERSPSEQAHLLYALGMMEGMERKDDPQE